MKMERDGRAALVRGPDGVERRLADVGDTSAAVAGVVCPQCGLKFSAGYALMAHRMRDAAGRASGPCLPEASLAPVLALVCFDRLAAPRWYTPMMGSDLGAAREARQRLVRALRDGSATPEQLRYVPVDPDMPESLLDLARLMVRAHKWP